ncbi:MAG: hypothetical protein M3Z20_11300 [Chloroflexota bacterium]|nr:hypothetical protein [Chloroflexota bacterium]
MTPRTLLTAIGATAIAFALAIGAAAGSVSSQTAPVIASTAAAQTTTSAQPAVALHTLAADHDCPVAL